MYMSSVYLHSVYFRFVQYTIAQLSDQVMALTDRMQEFERKQ